MGNGPSKQTIETITSNISKTILNAFQNSQASTTVKQQVSGKCDINTVKSISESYTSCIISNIDKFDTDDLLDVCSVYSSICTMSDIDLSATININTLKTQDSTIKQEIETNVRNTLFQYGGSKTDQYIKNITDNISNIVDSIIEKLQNNNIIQQEINLNAVQGKFISLKTSLKTISETIQKDNIMSNNISDIANTITQISLNDNSIYNTTLSIAILIIFSGILISIVMTLKRSDNLTDFFYRILPILIYFVLATIITIIHILTKPGYVSFYDKNGKKILDKRKLFLYLMLYYFMLGIIIFVVNRIYKRKK